MATDILENLTSIFLNITISQEIVEMIPASIRSFKTPDIYSNIVNLLYNDSDQITEFLQDFF